MSHRQKAANETTTRRCIFSQVWSQVNIVAAGILNAKVSSILKQGSWHFPPASSEAKVHFQSGLPQIAFADEDSAQWMISTSRRFTCSSAWNEIRVKHEEVDWWKLIWPHTSIPKNSFICWLATINRLSTRERLVKWRYDGEFNVFSVETQWRVVIFFSFIFFFFFYFLFFNVPSLVE